MPRISERQLLLSEIDIAAKNMVLFEFGDDDEIDELLELKALLMDSRFLNMRQFARKNKSMNEMLWFLANAYENIAENFSAFLRRISLVLLGLGENFSATFFCSHTKFACHRISPGFNFDRLTYWTRQYKFRNFNFD
jgi:hypothetical protein